MSPLNLGTDELVTINELVETGQRNRGQATRHCLDQLKKPQGVRGRNSDNHKILELFGWQPSILLKQGLVPTYSWIDQQLKDLQHVHTEEAG